MIIAVLAIFVLIVAASYSFYHASGAALAGRAALAVTPEKKISLAAAGQVASLVRPTPAAAERPAPPKKARRPGAAETLAAWGSALLRSYAGMFVPSTTGIVVQRLDVPFPPADAHHIARPLALVYRSTVYVGAPFDLVLYILAPGQRGVDLVPPEAKNLDVQTALPQDLEFDAAEETPLIAVALGGKDAEFAIDAGGATLLKRLGLDDVAYHFLVKPTLAQTCILTLTVSYVTPSAPKTLTETTRVVTTADAATVTERGAIAAAPPRAAASYPVMSVAVPIAVKTVANLSAAQLQGARWIAGTVVTLIALGFFLSVAPASDQGTVRILGLLAVAAQLGLPVSDKLSVPRPKA